MRVAREAEAIAICSGAFFGGVRAVALMGATGLLTCTGELATLNLRHQIPVFLIVSQRGSIDDHRIYQEVQGRRTIPLLETYDFPYHIVDRPDEVSSIPDAFETCRLQKRPFVLFLTRQAGEGGGHGMRAREAIDVLARHRGDAVAVCALGMAANEWWAATKSEDSFYMHGAMGFAASFALGLALVAAAGAGLADQRGRLALHESRLPADGSLAGARGTSSISSSTTASTRPSARCRWSTRAAPTTPPSRARRDFRARARIETLDELERQLPAIAAEDGPSFTVLRVEPETGFLRTPPMTYEGPEMKYRFGRALERRFGIEVFGPQGY